MDTLITGSAYCCGDGITVYQIIPESHWTMKKMDPDSMSDWVFETVESDCNGTPGAFKNKGYEIVVAGESFGCGSKSVEHPMAALKAAGIKVILAESVSRYSYRNAINLGIPVLICPGISQMVHKNDVLSVDLSEGIIRNTTNGMICRTQGLSDFALSIISSGGLISYIRKQINL